MTQQPYRQQPMNPSRKTVTPAIPQQLTVTDGDIIRCECGCEYFTSAFCCVKAKSPLLGQPQMIGTIQASQRLICVACHSPVDPNQVETRAEHAARLVETPEPAEEPLIVQP